MFFNKSDLRQMDNLIKALKKGSFNLDGMEVLAMSDAMKWLNNLYNTGVEEVKNQEMKASSVQTIPDVAVGLEVKKTESRKKKT